MEARRLSFHAIWLAAAMIAGASASAWIQPYGPQPNLPSQWPKALQRPPGPADDSFGPDLTIRWDKATGAAYQITTSAAAPTAGDPAQLAREFLSEAAPLMHLPSNLNGLVQGRVRASPGGFHTRFDQVHQGIPVFGAFVTVHLNRQGALRMIKSRFRERVMPSGIVPWLDYTTAIQTTLQGLAVVGPLRAAPRADLVIFPADDGDHLAWLVQVPARTPLGDWLVFVDAYSGRVLLARNILKFATGQGMIFNPNPITTSGNTGLRDNDDRDTSELNGQRQSVDMRDLNGSGFLIGPYVNTWPTFPRAFQPSLSFNYTRADDRFEEVMAYYHIDSTERYIRSLGFSDVMNRSIGANVHGGFTGNAYFSTMTGEVTFGEHSSMGPDFAEDADVIVHEYGHAVQDDIVEWWGLLYDGGAMGEGFADYLAITKFEDIGPRAWRTLLGEWAGGGRRVDSGKRYPNDLDGEVHADGEIWSQTLWKIHEKLGRYTANKIIIQSHFYLEPFATFQDGAEALLLADEDLFGGTHKDDLRKILVDQGFLVNPAAPRAIIGIHSVFSGDLSQNTVTVTLGVGNPLSPSFSRVVFKKLGPWGGDRGWRTDIDLSEDISAASSYLPPNITAKRWFLKVSEVNEKQKGSITTFGIKVGNSVYWATDTPKPLSSLAETISYVPSHADATTPFARIAIRHSNAGDLLVRVGVGNIVEPNWQKSVYLGENRASPDLFLEVNISGGQSFLPPRADKPWFLEVLDTAEGDVGDLLGFTITYQGQTYAAVDLPRTIADFSRVVSWIPRRPMTSFARLEIQHSARGDLVATVGVGPPGNPLWTAPVSLQQGATANDIFGEVDLSLVAHLLPPSEQRRWFVNVEDRAELDGGFVTRFLIEHLGKRYDATDVPISINDLDTSRSFIPRLPAPMARVEIDHQFTIALRVAIGVGPPDRPLFSQTLWNRNGQMSNNIYRDFALAAGAAAYLPPSSSNPWFLAVTHVPDYLLYGYLTYTQSSGIIKRFEIHSQGTGGRVIHSATDLPVFIRPDSTVVSRIPAAAVPLFADVSAAAFYRPHAEAVWRNGIMRECAGNPLRFCPSDLVKRRHMARFIILARGGPTFSPSVPTFNDVPPTDPDFAYIEAVRKLGIASGCSAAPPLFCPDGNVTREQMTKFLLNALGLAPFNNPTPTFQDVPKTDLFYPFVEGAAKAGIATGCQAAPPLFCPAAPVPRSQMAIFLVRAFNIPTMR